MRLDPPRIELGILVTQPRGARNRRGGPGGHARRAARHFAAEDLDAKALLREFLLAQGLRAPTEAKLVEMLAAGAFISKAT